MPKIKRVLYIQSGGMTSVINRSAQGVMDGVKSLVESSFSELYAAKHGVQGLMKEQFYDLSSWHISEKNQIERFPGGFFGSSRIDLEAFEDHQSQYKSIFNILNAHNIRAVILNGGGGSMKTALNLSLAAEALDYPLKVIGIPKTIDNDIFHTDTCPGFGSAARFLALSLKTIACDMQAMSGDAPKIFVLETMGRRTGWLAAAAAMASSEKKPLPIIILVPEHPVSQDQLFAQSQAYISQFGYCLIAVAEGYPSLATTEAKESVGVSIAHQLHRAFNVHTRFALPDYLQRSAHYQSSQTDIDQAYEVGKTSVELLSQKQDRVMVTIERLSDEPYHWQTGQVDLEEVADLERPLPIEFYDTEILSVTPYARRYFFPLLTGPTEIDEDFLQMTSPERPLLVPRRSEPTI